MAASIIFDISLAILAILIVFKFTVKGFIRSLLDLSKAIISLALAFLLRIPIANFINALFMENFMVDAVRSSLVAYLNQDLDEIYIDVERMPDVLKSFLAFFNLDIDKFNSDFEAFFTNKDVSVIDSLSGNVGGALATLVSTIIAFAIITVVAYIILSVIFYFISHLRHFDGVKTVDRVMGIILGFAIAFAILWFCSWCVLLVIKYVGPIAPEYIDKEFAEKSMVVSGVERVIAFFKYVGNFFKNIFS